MCSKIKENRKPRCEMSLRAAGQQGFVLVLALVMLAVLTLIGVSSMNSANMELRSTANAQQHQQAFNGVQSLLEYTVSKPVTDVINFQPSALELSTTQTVTHSVANASSLIATINHTGCSVGVGSSLEEGKGFSYNFFDIRGTGYNETSSGAKGAASSTQTQGVRFPAAACN